MKKREPFFSHDFEVCEALWAKRAGLWRKFRSGQTKLPLPCLEEGDLQAWVDERKYVEDIVYKRLAFLLTIVGVVTAAVLTIKKPIPSFFVLLVGAWAIRMLSFSVERAWAKACFLIAALIAYGYKPLIVGAHYFDKSEPSNRFRGVRALEIVGRSGPKSFRFAAWLFVVWSMFGIVKPSWWLPQDNGPIVQVGIPGRQGPVGPEGQKGPRGLQGIRGRRGLPAAK